MLIRVFKNTKTVKDMVKYLAPNELKNLIKQIKIDGRLVDFDLLVQLKEIPQNNQFLEIEFMMDTDNPDIKADEVNLADPNWMTKYLNTHWFGPIKLAFKNVGMTYKNNVIEISGTKKFNLTEGMFLDE